MGLLYGPSGLLQINYESLKHCGEEETQPEDIAIEPDDASIDVDTEGMFDHSRLHFKIHRYSKMSYH